MFTAAALGDATRWSAPSAEPDPIFGVHLKYDLEYIRTKWSCGLCEAGRPHAEAHCCWSVGSTWSRELMELLGGKMQSWDARGECTTFEPTWLLRLLPFLGIALMVTWVVGRRRCSRGHWCAARGCPTGA
eukprot:3215339-Prymnesium_polylepis.1